MQEGPWRQTSGAHRRGRAGATQRETEPDTSGGRRQRHGRRGPPEPGLGPDRESGDRAGGQRQERPGGSERQGDGGEGRRCLGEKEGWRKSEIEMERDRGREREVKRQGMGRGRGWAGVRDTEIWRDSQAKEMNRKQSQRQGETESNGGERQWLRDREMGREMDRNRGTRAEETRYRGGAPGEGDGKGGGSERGEKWEREGDRQGRRNSKERGGQRAKRDRWRERVTNKHRARNPKIWGVNTGGGLDAGGDRADWRDRGKKETEAGREKEFGELLIQRSSLFPLIPSLPIPASFPH